MIKVIGYNGCLKSSDANSPDGSGNPFLGRRQFLLLQNSDRRKLILWLAKTKYGKKDWNVQLEIAP